MQFIIEISFYYVEKKRNMFRCVLNTKHMDRQINRSIDRSLDG